MYRLYDINEKTLLDESNREEDIINTLAEYMKEYLKMGFVVERDEIPYKTIRGVSDYYHYVNDYNIKKNTEELKQMSCLELKREMLDLNDRARVRVKRNEFK